MSNDLTFPVTIKNAVRQTPDSVHLEFTVPESFNYKTAGQYVKVEMPGHKPSYFALASLPSEKTAAILVKQSSPLTAALLGLKAGDSFIASAAMGNGFQMNDAAGKDLFFFAVGSGIAPIRAALNSALQNPKKYGEIGLYFGARNVNEFAYADELNVWADKGVIIVQTISNPDDDAWAGAKGYVQNLINRRFHPQKTLAYLCGMKGMIAGVTEKLVSLGVPAENIRTNY